LNKDVYFFKVNKSIWQLALFLLRRFVVLTKDGYTTNKSVEEIKLYWDKHLGPEFAKTIFGNTWVKKNGAISKDNPNQWRFERSRDMNSLLRDNDFWGKLAQREQIAYLEYKNFIMEETLNENSITLPSSVLKSITV
jgi:hypothetical protein